MTEKSQLRCKKCGRFIPKESIGYKEAMEYNAEPLCDEHYMESLEIDYDKAKREHGKG